MHKFFCVLVAAASFLGIGDLRAANLHSAPWAREDGTGKSGPADSDLDQTKNTLTEAIQQILKVTSIPSISIALLRSETIVWAEAFGNSHVKLQVPASPNTIYSTGSCFKSVTAMAVTQLVDRGKFNLDEPVND